MKWVKLLNGDYQAVGKFGDFLIWRDGRVWKARYRTTDKKTCFHLPISFTIKEAMRKCRENYYWEIKK